MGNTFTYTKDPSEDIKQKIINEHQTEEDRYEWPRAPKDPMYFRQYDGRPDPRVMTAWIKSPFTEVYDNTTNVQHQPLCGQIELGMMNCLEAYGLPNGFYKCRDFMDDYNECTGEDKRYKRCKVMRRERQRQYRQGEREIKYAMPPKPGSLSL